MRISDWSSDVCSSDLIRETGGSRLHRLPHRRRAPGRRAGIAGRAEQLPAVADTRGRTVPGVARRGARQRHAGSATRASAGGCRAVARHRRFAARRTGTRGDGPYPAFAPALATRHGHRGHTMSHYDQLWLFFALVFGIFVLPGLYMAFVIVTALAGGRRRTLPALARLKPGRHTTR